MEQQVFTFLPIKVVYGAGAIRMSATSLKNMCLIAKNAQLQ